MDSASYNAAEPVYRSNERGESRALSALDLLDYFHSGGLMRISDLHLKVGQPPCYRVDGDLRRIKGEPLTAPVLRRIVFSLLSEEDRAAVDRHADVDTSYLHGDYQFRINVFCDSDGPAAAIRALPLAIPRVEDIGFANHVWEDIIERKQGLVLVTGITGSGKSTTIAALIERINQTRECRIITLEDPIEYIYHQDRCLISQRELGRHVDSFASGLRSMMREDPDVIFVGEMRDAESISWTLTVAETGHLVFSTLHTRDARGSITRILDHFSSGRREEARNQLSMGLAYVLSQKLIPRADGKGRVLAMEILNNNYAVANLIRTDRIDQIGSQIQTKTKDRRDERMMTMERCLVNLVVAGIVDREEAGKWANDYNVYLDMLEDELPGDKPPR